MSFDAAIFDFDGTLVDSAAAKRDAFYVIFPQQAGYQAIVAGVLRDDPDGSRHDVIPRMLAIMQAAGLTANLALSGHELVDRYASVSEQAVRRAPEIPGAGKLLAALSSRMQLHVCSNTPVEAVRAHIAARGWSRHFATVAGHPAVKTERVAEILHKGSFDPQRVAVIGDGVSDAAAARNNGCQYIAIKSPDDLAAAGRILGVDHV
jgi:phosphoglycolate phosphatase-like HAD superfamily hydrolase